MTVMDAPRGARNDDILERLEEKNTGGALETAHAAFAAQGAKTGYATETPDRFARPLDSVARRREIEMVNAERRSLQAAGSIVRAAGALRLSRDTLLGILAHGVSEIATDPLAEERYREHGAALRIARSGATKDYVVVRPDPAAPEKRKALAALGLKRNVMRRTFEGSALAADVAAMVADWPGTQVLVVADGEERPYAPEPPPARTPEPGEPPSRPAKPAVAPANAAGNDMSGVVRPSLARLSLARVRPEENESHNGS